MSAVTETLLSHLDGVRERRPGQWMAKCPAHDDSRPSLLIEVGDDERLLVFCYAGCGAAEVVAAIGLTLADLFPHRLPDVPGRHHRRRPTLSARDVIDALDHESSVVMVIAADILAGRTISADDMERVMLVRQRINRVAEIVR